MIQNIFSPHVECIFERQPEQLGLCHAVLCAERPVAGEPFAVFLVDDFLTDYAPGVTSDPVAAFEQSGKSQMSVMEVNGPEISKYGVINQSCDGTVIGVLEKPSFEEAPSNLASIGRYVLLPTVSDALIDLPSGSVDEVQLAGAINLIARAGCVEAVMLKGLRFYCRSVEGLVRHAPLATVP